MSFMSESENLEPLLSPAERDAVRQVTSTEKLKSRQQRGSFMAVMDPWNPPMRIKTPEKSSAGLSSCDLKLWLSALSAAIPLFLLSYSSCVSYAHLIVSGAVGYPIRAVVIMSMHLFSSGLTGLILPVRSKCPMIIPSADISVTIFYQKIVTDLVAAAEAEGAVSPEMVAATVMLALPLNTLLMSLVFYFVGEQKVTVVVSYLPYPVVAGFLGSIGLAIFLGSFAVLEEGLQGFGGILKAANDRPYELLSAAGMAIGSILLKYVGLPARVLAVAPTLVTLVLFWTLVMMDGASLDAWREAGWLFPMADFEPFWSLWSEQRISLVAWKLLPPRLGTFLGLGFVLVLSLTLRIAGIEGSTGSAINVDDEVKWTGLASAAAGLCGTVIGSHSPGLTTFNVEAGSTTAQAAVLTGVFQLLLWLIGFPVMNMFPRFLLSGILMNLGLVMLQEWMWTARHKVGILGLLVIYAQVASSAMYGLLPSVLVGVAVALLTAQAQLMRLHVLKYHVSRLSVRTNLQRSQQERALLSQHGNFIECLGLEGFLAEGPIIKLSNYVRHYVENNRMLRFMIFDLQACQGCNVSAYALLAKLDKVLLNEGIEALYSSLDPEMSNGLKSFGVPQTRIFDTLSSSNSSFLQALERCEDMLLESLLEGFQRQISPILEVSEIPVMTMQSELKDFLGLSQEQTLKLVQAGSFCHKGVNTRLARQGVVEQNMYIAVPNYSKVVETVDVGSNCGAEQEVSLSRLGFICCLESVLYDEPARATCRVLIPSQLLQLSKVAVQQLVDSDPSLGNCLSRLFNRQCLRQSDALQQALQLSEGGGWKGGHFDRHTASVCMKMIDHEKQGEREEVPAAFSKFSSPTVIRRRRPLSPKGKVFRASTIENWSMNWVENRQSV